MKTSILFLTAFLIFGLHSSFASPSGEKTTEKKAASDEMDARAEYNRGLKNMEKAKEVAEKDDSTYAFNYRATSDAKAKKEYEKAVEKFKKAISYKEKFPEAYNNLGYCFRKLGNLKESLAAYHKALEQRPNFPQAHEYLGETYLALDSMDQARGQLQILTELESPLADTLKKAIELYRLSMVKEKMSDSKED